MRTHLFKLAPLFSCFIVAALFGCATDWAGYARNGEFDKAYNNLEYNLSKGTADVGRAWPCSWLHPPAVLQAKTLML